MFSRAGRTLTQIGGRHSAGMNLEAGLVLRIARKEADHNSSPASVEPY